MTRSPMDEHPSGRPLRRETPPRALPIERIPAEGPLTPRLQQPRKDIAAIGFTVGIGGDGEDGA